MYLRYSEKVEVRLFSKVFVILSWVMFYISLIFPSVWINAAKILGIGRGVDLLFYTSLFMTLATITVVFIKIHNIEKRLAFLARKISVTHYIDKD
jgi:hypothetical protein